MSDFWKDWNTSDFYIEIKKSEYNWAKFKSWIFGLNSGLIAGYILDRLIDWLI